MRVEIIVRVVDPEISYRPLHVDIDDAGHARAVVHTLDVEFDVAPLAFPDETVWDLLRRVVEVGESATGLYPHGRIVELHELTADDIELIENSKSESSFNLEDLDDDGKRIR